jgi:membrane-associated phospholipid phosphatase
MFDKLFSLEPDYFRLPSPLFDEDMTLSKMRDTLGFFAPLILFGLTVGKLAARPPYLVSYVVGFFMNMALNSVAKLWIKEERPEGGRNLFSWEHYSGPEKYGMPSLHAQSDMYSIVFLSSTGSSPAWIIFGLFLYSLTLYQRWSYRRHTIQQLIAGTGLGATLAWIIYGMTQFYLRTQSR